MKELETETLIIGAGPAGLAAAMTLLNEGKEFILVEKNDRVGGLSKTYEFSESGLRFRTDNGPHRFFTKNEILQRFVEDALNERWITVKRQTRQYLNGTFFNYPIDVGQAIRNIGLAKASVFAVDYLAAKATYSIRRKPIRNLADYAHSAFGKSLARFNILNYSQKIWGVPAEMIHSDWAHQRIRGLSLRTLLRAAVDTRISNDRRPIPKSLVDSFLYPERGSGTVYESIEKRIQEAGRRIFLKTYPTKVNHFDCRVRSVIVKGAKEEFKIICKHLVETVPLGRFVDLLSPPAPANVFSATSQLSYRSQVYLFLTLNRHSVSKDQWIYFPDKELPIARMSEMRNFSDYMSPPGKTSLFLEFFCSVGDGLWKANTEELTEMSIEYLSRHGFISRNDLRNSYHFREEDVYPFYGLNYQEHLYTIKSYLNGFTNLYYIGRPGRFRYNNQDHSLEMGIQAARCIADGSKFDFDSV